MVNLSDTELDFLSAHHAAAMITVDRSGVAKVARVGVAVVDGRVWSSGTADRVRTRRLRRDPRCTLFVFDGTFRWLSLESEVTILDGPHAPELNLALFREMQRRPTGPLTWFGSALDADAFRARMSEEGRLIYQFEISKAYGMLQAPSL